MKKKNVYFKVNALILRESIRHLEYFFNHRSPKQSRHLWNSVSTLLSNLKKKPAG